METGLKDEQVLKLLTELEGTLPKGSNLCLSAGHTQRTTRAHGQTKPMVGLLSMTTANKEDMIFSLKSAEEGVCGQGVQSQRRKGTLFLGGKPSTQSQWEVQAMFFKAFEGAKLDVRKLEASWTMNSKIGDQNRSETAAVLSCKEKFASSEPVVYRCGSDPLGFDVSQPGNPLETVSIGVCLCLGVLCVSVCVCFLNMTEISRGPKREKHFY